MIRVLSGSIPFSCIATPTPKKPQNYQTAFNLCQNNSRDCTFRISSARTPEKKSQRKSNKGDGAIWNLHRNSELSQQFSGLSLILWHTTPHYPLLTPLTTTHPSYPRRARIPEGLVLGPVPEQFLHSDPSILLRDSSQALCTLRRDQANLWGAGGFHGSKVATTTEAVGTVGPPFQATQTQSS